MSRPASRCTTSRWTPRRAVVLAAASLVLSLGACSPPLPTPQPDAVPVEVQPAVSPDQVDRVLTDVDAVLRAADAAGDVAALEPRVEGPAQATRQAQYVLRAAGIDGSLTALPTVPQTIMTSATEEWPRTLVVVTEPPEDLQAPLLLTLVQDSPRDPYRLWAWARLFPSVQMPPTATPELGSTPVAMDAAGLVVPPGQVLGQYADLLTHGDASVYAAAFTPDPLHAGIDALREGYLAAVGANGTLTETYQPGGEGPYAIATADGGAIVIGTIRTVTTMTFSDSTVTFGPQTMALLGKEQVTSNLETTWLSTVAFHVPPEGSADPIELLGAEHQQIQVSGE